MADNVTVPAAPVLATIRGVELAKVGDWPASTGIWHATAGDLANAVAALDCPAVRRPVLKLGHVDPRFDGEPAIGYVANLATTDEGSTLIGDWAGMPGWLASPNADGETVAASAYPDRSIEGEYDLHCSLGHVHPFVLTAVALLGVSTPAVGTLASLQDIATLYGVAASTPTGGRPVRAQTGGTMPQTQPVQASVSTEDVRRAYYDGPAESQWSWWVQSIYLDPPQLIVCDDSDGDLYRVPYAVDGQTITFSDPIPVRVEYVDAPGDDGNTQTVAARAAAVVFASRGDSRPHAPVAAASGSQKGAGMDPAKLREVLGLTADASNTEVAAALAVAGVIPKASEETTPAAAATTDPAPVAPVETTPVAAALLPEAVREQLAEQSAELAAIRAERVAAARETVIGGAVRAGKIAPADRAKWEARYDKAPDVTGEILAATATGAAVPVTAAGYAGDDTGDIDAEYASLFPTGQEG